MIFDEGLTSSPELTRWAQPTKVGQFFQTRGGSLGVGLASSIGVQVANHGKTVLAVSGDGGAMYTIQALWSAARHNLPVKYIVCNNRSYRLLQANIHQYWIEQGITDRPFPLSFDLSKPDLQFAEMAKALGVAGRVSRRLRRSSRPWRRCSHITARSSWTWLLRGTSTRS